MNQRPLNLTAQRQTDLMFMIIATMGDCVEVEEHTPPVPALLPVGTRVTEEGAVRTTEEGGYRVIE